MRARRAAPPRYESFQHGHCPDADDSAVSARPGQAVATSLGMTRTMQQSMARPKAWRGMAAPRIATAANYSGDLATFDEHVLFIRNSQSVPSRAEPRHTPLLTGKGGAARQYQVHPGQAALCFRF